MEKIVTLLLMPAMEILVPIMLNVMWWKLEDFRKYSAFCQFPFRGGFTTMSVINPPERKLAKRTSVHLPMEFVL